MPSGVLRSPVCLGGGPVVVPHQMELDFIVLELRPLPAPSAAEIAPYRSRVQTGAAGAAGGAGHEARLSIPCAISQVLGPLRTAPGARDRHARTLFRMLSLVSRSQRDPSDAFRRAPEGRSFRGSVDA